MTCTYDDLNRLETVIDPATGTTTYTYDHVGNLKTVTSPNGTIAEYTYDALNRLTYMENRTADGIVISSYTYTLDNAGNRTKVEEHTGRTVEYTYDATDKLLEETITNPDTSVSVIIYTYDNVGNRLTKTENGFTTTYVYDDNNRLVQEDDVRYSYDDNGNLTEKESAEEDVLYFYDAENHLIRVETTRFGATIVVEYAYDDAGNRVRKTIDDTVVIKYLVDTNRDYAQVLEERDGDGNLLVRYVYGHDLISQTRGGATSYYHYDGLGSTRALTNGSEGVTDTYTYDAFGLIFEQIGTTENPYLYRGEQFDPELGFYYLRARYMSPDVGRFVTMDAFSGFSRDPYSLHKYLYANANPVNLTDPSGYFSLVETQIASSIRSLLANIQIDVGMAIFDQIVFGGNAGLGSLAFGGVFRLGVAYGPALLKGALGRLARNPAAGAFLQRISPFILAHICKLRYVAPIFVGLALDQYYKMQEAVEQGDIVAGLSAFSKCTGFLTLSISIWNSFACFPEDTLIYTNKGYTPIQDIEVGDEVYSENVETGEQGFKRVKKVFTRETRILVHLFLDNEEITTTPEHPFWVAGRGWVHARKLKIGDDVVLYSGNHAKISFFKQEILTQPITVYNFEVEEWHTYFFSSKGILVHNSCQLPDDPDDDILQVKHLTTLSFQEAGILDENGYLTKSAIENSSLITKGTDLGNQAVISELTRDGSNLADWGKYTTESIEIFNGQKKQIHFYYNKVTGVANYVYDYKVKNPVHFWRKK